MKILNLSEIDSSWVFNVLNIYNFNKPGPYEFIFDFLCEKGKFIEGNVLEAGTYKGRMSIALSIFISHLKLDKTLHTFDTFSGFPSYHENDQQLKFDELFKTGQISQDQFNQICKLRKIRQSLTHQEITTNNISTSGNFSNSSLDEVISKIDLLGLENIIVHEGTFKETMSSFSLENEKYCLAFIDCDLYDGYIQSLNHVWPRMQRGGIVFLDEYYSLKFPGAFIATNEYLKNWTDYEKINVASKGDDFQRWVLVKK